MCGLHGNRRRTPQTERHDQLALRHRPASVQPMQDDGPTHRPTTSAFPTHCPSQCSLPGLVPEALMLLGLSLDGLSRESARGMTKELQGGLVKPRKASSLDIHTG